MSVVSIPANLSNGKVGSLSTSQLCCLFGREAQIPSCVDLSNELNTISSDINILDMKATNINIAIKIVDTNISNLQGFINTQTSILANVINVSEDITNGLIINSESAILDALSNAVINIDTTVENGFNIIINDIANIEVDLIGINGEIVSLNTSISGLTASLGNTTNLLSAEINTVQGDISSLSNTLALDVSMILSAIANISAGVSQSAYIYHLGLATVAINAPVLFNNIGAITSGFSYNPVTGILTVVNAGLYNIVFTVATNEPNQFTLFDNGVPIPGTTYGSGAGTQPSTGQVIVSLGAGDQISLVNYATGSAVTLQDLAGGTQHNVNASISIRSL